MRQETLPRRIGPYHLSGEMGRGNMGIVYAGHHKDTGLPAAVKTVTSPEVAKLAQIRRETRALARLEHPGVVKILDHGIYEGGPWYAMEQLSGTTLADVIKHLWGKADLAAPSEEDEDPTLETEGQDQTMILETGPGVDAAADPLPSGMAPRLRRRQAAAGRLADALQLVHHISQTCSFIHGEGVVHRDLKPSNIFLKGGNRPVLVDFGLVSDTHGGTARESIDQTDKFGGSPAFMAPEQIRGDALDARCDLYALGCILYLMVTGLTPFSGTRQQILDGHLNRVPVRPSDLVDGVPQALEELILSLLEKTRNKRLGYAENVALVLEELGARPCAEIAAAKVKPYLYRASYVDRASARRCIVEGLEAARSGAGQILLLSGESGAGKTRQLVESAKAALRSDMAVASGQCQAQGLAGVSGFATAKPLSPLLPLLDQVADYCTEGGVARFRAILGPHCRVLEDYSDNIKASPLTEAWPAVPELPNEDARNRLFRALKDVVAAYAQEQPLLVILDDLQWADELTMGFLAHVAQTGLEEAPVLLLGSFRSEERNAPLDTLLEAAVVREIVLSRMARPETEALAEGMLAVPALPRSFADFLMNRSNGNPFFIAEYLRSAVAEQVLTRSPKGKWVFAGTDQELETRYEALPLPESIRDLIDMRLAGLSEEARQAADCAALAGRQFEIGLITQVTGYGEEAMADVIDELVGRQVLEPDETTGFRFLHDKIREVADGLLKPEIRRSWHKRIAETLDSGAGEPGTRELLDGRLGRHWSGAGISDKAVHHLRRAGEEAHRYHAVEEATQYLQAALEEISRAAPDRATRSPFFRDQLIALNEKLADLLMLKRRHADARAALEAALAEPGLPALTRVRLTRMTGKTFEDAHEHDKALATYAEAEALLAACETPDAAWMDEKIDIKLRRLWVHYWSAKAEAVDAELAETRLLIEEYGRPAHRYGFYFSQILSRLRRQRYQVDPETVQLGANLLAAAMEAQGEADIAFAQFELGFLLLFAGKLEAAEPELQSALNMYRAIGEASGETRALCYQTILFRRMNRVSEVETLACELEERARADRMTDYVGISHALSGWAALKRGDLAGARKKTRDAKACWDSLSFIYSMQWTGLLTGLHLAVAGKDPVEAAKTAEQLLHPVQMKLPDRINDALANAVTAHEDGQDQDVIRRAQDALRAAEELGFL